MASSEETTDYPVSIDRAHIVEEPVGYDGGKYTCKVTGAYTHTGAWPTWDYCPYCGRRIQ